MLMSGGCMKISYRMANENDAELIIELYNEIFLEDYIKYGKCPAYGRSIEDMIASIQKTEKHIIYTEELPVGVISLENKGGGHYYLGCLGVIPEYQHHGIGTEAVKYILDYYIEWKQFTLVTPEDKTENIAFYTKKCGFSITGTEMDGNVKVVRFLLQR